MNYSPAVYDEMYRTLTYFKIIYLTVVLVWLIFRLVRSSFTRREVRHKAHVVKRNRHIKHRKLTLFRLNQTHLSRLVRSFWKVEKFVIKLSLGESKPSFREAKKRKNSIRNELVITHLCVQYSSPSFTIWNQFFNWFN